MHFYKARCCSLILHFTVRSFGLARSRWFIWVFSLRFQRATGCRRVAFLHLDVNDFLFVFIWRLIGNCRFFSDAPRSLSCYRNCCKLFELYWKFSEWSCLLMSSVVLAAIKSTKTRSNFLIWSKHTTFTLKSRIWKFRKLQTTKLSLN